METALYRIAQEALNNVAKHSRARRVEVILERRPDCVLLILEDDGVGFDGADGGKARQGFGLVGMQERAALVGAQPADRIDARARGRPSSCGWRCPPRAGQVVDHA